MTEIKKMRMIDLLDELRDARVERDNLASEGVWPSVPTHAERSNRAGSFFYRFFRKDKAGRLLSPTGKADLTIPKRDPYQAEQMSKTFKRTKRYFDLEVKERDLQREIDERRKKAQEHRNDMLSELRALRIAKQDIEARIDEIEYLLKEEQDEGV